MGFPPGHFVRHAKPVRQGALFGLLGQGEAFLDFGLELGFDLLGMAVGQGTMTAALAWIFGAIQADRAEFGQPIGLGHFEDLDEGCLKRGQGVVVGMSVTGEVAEGNRVVGGHFDLAAEENAGGVAIDEQAQQIGWG